MGRGIDCLLSKRAEFVEEGCSQDYKRPFSKRRLSLKGFVMKQPRQTDDFLSQNIIHTQIHTDKKYLSETDVYLSKFSISMK